MDDLRKLQLLQLNTLKEVVRICEKYKITYYMMYGSLLGAVRHQGFIPWDDDLDIVMERNEYNRFLECASKDLDSRYFLHTNATDSRYFVSFARLRMNDTVFIPKVYENAGFCHNGIWIDIFPLDYANSNKSLFERVRYISMIKLLRPMAALNVCGVSENSRFRKCFLAWVAKKIRLSVLLNIIERVSTAHNNTVGKYLVCFGSPYKMIKCYFPTDFFGSGKECDFEGVKVRIPINYDGVLKIIYGDYMKLPPENQRIGHLPVLFDCSKVDIPME